MTDKIAEEILLDRLLCHTVSHVAVNGDRNALMGCLEIDIAVKAGNQYKVSPVNFQSIYRVKGKIVPCSLNDLEVTSPDGEA